MMSLLEIQETIKKHITVIRKTIIRPGIDVIIAIPKKETRIERKEND